MISATYKEVQTSRSAWQLVARRPMEPEHAEIMGASQEPLCRNASWPLETSFLWCLWIEASGGWWSRIGYLRPIGGDPLLERQHEAQSGLGAAISAPVRPHPRTTRLVGALVELAAESRLGIRMLPRSQ